MRIESFEAHKITHGAIDYWLVAINGRPRKLQDWCRDLGISMNTVRARMVKHNWEIREALLKPVIRGEARAEAYAKALGVECFWKHAKQHFESGRSHTDFADQLGLPVSTVFKFLKKHESRWKVETSLGMELESPDGVIWESVVEGGRYRLYTTPRYRYVQEGDGPLLRLSEWCKRSGMAVGTLNFRIASGWALDQALETKVVRAHEEGRLQGIDRLLRSAWGGATRPGEWRCYSEKALAGA